MNLLKTIPRRWMKTGLAAVLIVTAAFFYVSGHSEAAVHTTADAILAEDFASAEQETAVLGEILTGNDASVGNNDAVSGPAESLPEEVVWVHICGEVKKPGVYEVPNDSRLIALVEMAGGFTEHAAEEAVNLAQMVSDGQQIRIPSLEDYEELKNAAGGNLSGTGGNLSGTGGNLSETCGNPAADSGGLININLADKQELMTLPGIGEARAEAIISYREASGGFVVTSDIMKVSGIKENAFAKIKDKIRV